MRGNLSPLQLPVSWKASSRILYLFVITVFSVTQIRAVKCFKSLEITPLKCSEALHTCPYFNECFQWFKIFSYCFDGVGLPVLNQNFRDFSFFNVDFKRRNCPSARCASVANAVDSDTDIRKGRSVSVNIIGQYLILFYYVIQSLSNFRSSSTSNFCVSYIKFC